MSHASGIPVAPELDQSFGKARENKNVRFIKVQIKDDVMVETASQPIVGTAETDFPLIQKVLERNVPAYILYRLDTEESLHGNDWLLISYVPDGSPVKSRMVYASSLALLKRDLGTSYFSDELHGSAPDDITWELYLQHDKKRGVVDAPLTQAEISRGAEVTMEFDPGHSREYVHSVAFPMSSAAVAALKDIKSSNVVQLRIDTEKETIELREKFSSSNVAGVANKIPSDEPCFTFFRFVHQHDGQEVAPVIFIYSCTDGAKVKARMLYSTVKSAAIEAATTYGITVEKKLEISDPEDLSESDLLADLHPAAREISVKQAFNRPARPGRGRPRVTK